MSNKLKVYNMFRAGFEILRDKREEKDKKSIGTLRGGSLVALTEDGKFIGDPRTALIRYLGLQERVTYDQNLLFQAGLANEDLIHEYLDALGTEYKCEEQIPVKITTPKGRTVTGRPDAMLFTDGEPDVLLEYKGIFGATSAIKNFFGGKRTPKDINILQCAFYAKYHGVDGLLIYTNRSHHKQNISPTRQKDIKDINHRAIQKNSKGYITGVKPYQSFYDITWQGEDLYVDGEKTVITYADIMRGYDYVADLAESQTPPPRYLDVINVWGEKQWSSNMFYIYDECDHSNWEAFIEGVELVNSGITG